MSFQEKMQYLGTHTSFVVICRITLSKELNKYAIEHYTSPIAELLCVKWEGNCGLWVLNEMIKNIHILIV